jgi:hypothetical protein
LLWPWRFYCAIKQRGLAKMHVELNIVQATNGGTRLATTYPRSLGKLSCGLGLAEDCSFWPGTDTVKGHIDAVSDGSAIEWSGGWQDSILISGLHLSGFFTRCFKHAARPFLQIEYGIAICV